MILTDEQRIALEKISRQTKDINERTRACAILARDDGYSMSEISDVLRISPSSVYDYLREYEKDGKTSNEPHAGKPCKLSAEQECELINHLQTNTYLKARAICKYILTKYGIDYTVQGVIDWLKRKNFIYKSPKHVPGKLDPQLQAAFIEHYKTLNGNLKDNEEIHFLDAVHPEYQSQVARGWILKNEVKTLGTTGKQQRLHFIGSVSLNDMKILTKEYQTVDTKSMIDFLETLDQTSPNIIKHVIADNARSNKNKELASWLQAHPNIQMHYLPPYSPNLNTIERLWKIMREHVTYNMLYPNFKEFAEAIRRFFQIDIGKLTALLKKRLTDNFQTILLNPLQTPI